MANEPYGSIIHNGVNYSLGDGANSAKKPDLTDIILTGTTNTSGGTISAGTWFYLNSKLVKAKVDIASNATFTKDTNYEEKTIGEELSELNGNSGGYPSSLTPINIFNIDALTSTPFIGWANGGSGTFPASNKNVGFIIHQPFHVPSVAGTWIFQRFYTYNGQGAYYRYYDGNAWGTWMQI